MKTCLITIDPQNDFCTPLAPGADPKTARFGFEKAALLVEGADSDMARLAQFITKNQKRLDEISCTLDSHQLFHIAHPPFWVDSKGNNPPPFTPISVDDVINGKWRPFNPRWQSRAKTYVETLQKNNRYTLFIWRPHCLISTWGHQVVTEVSVAFYEWERATFNRVNYITKGSNLFTEHYSAIMADVSDPTDPSTKINTSFLDTLVNFDDVIITGEALSHCVCNTVTDIANNFGEENIKKLILLLDTTSSVKGFEKLGDDFIKNMCARGMRTTTTKDY